jgi:iron complex outermembrane receptor protein
MMFRYFASAAPIAMVALAMAPASAQQVPTSPSGDSVVTPATPIQVENSGNTAGPLEAASPTAADDTSGDIIVTAQRTESLASRTPVALSAISGDALRTGGVTNPTQLGDQVPNLAITRGNGLQITIRGVTSTDGSEKGDPSAAFLLDGIYIARPQVQETSFFDIARVEVLRGPQGTLYGRNTTAGVVNVISNRPVDRFEGSVNGVYGNFDTAQIDAMVNIPVSDWLALRASGSYDRRDNFLHTSPGDQNRLDPFKENISGRLQALLTFSDSANLLLRGDYSSLKGTPVQVVRGIRFFDVTNPRDPVRLPTTSRALRTLGYLTAQQGDQNNDTYGISGELNWDFGPLALTYLGSYREFNRDEKLTTLLGSPVASTFTGTYRQNSQELRFATTGKGPLKAQFGGYYFREKSGIDFFLRNALPGVPFYGFPQNPVINETYAFFGQATYSILPTLRFTGGARYSHDDKSRVGGTVRQQTLTFNPATDSLLLNAAETTSSKVTYRAGLEFDAGDRTLLYGTFSTGYKAGGFNDGCAAGSVTNGIACNQVRPLDILYYQPETLTAYEIGVKTRFADNAIRINASAFYYDYKNLQLAQLIIVNGGPSSQTSNAAKARVKGIEVEAVVTPIRNNRFDASFTYLDAYYADYLPLAATVPTLSYSGRALDRSPKVVVSAGYNFTQPLGNGGDIQFGARTRLSDSYVLTAFSIPAQYRQPSFTQTDLTLTYNAPGQAWYIQGFGKNLEDTVTITSTDSRGNMSTSDPRTYGVRAGIRF